MINHVSLALFSVLSTQSNSTPNLEITEPGSISWEGLHHILIIDFCSLLSYDHSCPGSLDRLLIFRDQQYEVFSENLYLCDLPIYFNPCPIKF